MTTSSVESIYLIHHSHTDIGYTHDQPIVWDLHRRFLTGAIELAERDLQAGCDGDDAFRWTVETTGVLLHWLRYSSDRDIARFVDLVRAGRIEVTAMLANITPLYDTEQLIESFTPLRTVCDELQISVRSAMNSDVNGENWPLVDILLDLGVTGFSMAINTHFGGALTPHPLPFHWQGPSGRKLLAWNGFSYGLARQLGIGRDAQRFAEESWPRLDAWLAQIGYPLPVLMLQIFDAFGDNGPADPTLSSFVRDWNAVGMKPHLRLALPQEWWTVLAAHADRLSTLRGDWTDFWNFGCASSAREVAINRASRARLFAADAAWAALTGLAHEDNLASRPAAELRAAAQHALNFWDEHTWGADCSVRQPENEDTLVQWQHKASYAYTARSLSILLARDGVAELARHVARTADDALFIFNPLPWERTVAGDIPDPTPAAQRGRAGDPTASRHSQDRAAARAERRPTLRTLQPTRVPALGYTVVPSSQIAVATIETSSNTVVENHRHRLTFDVESGGVTSWLDRLLQRELVDHGTGWPLHGFIHERVAAGEDAWSRRLLLWSPPGAALPPQRGWHSDWPAVRTGATQVLEHRVERSDLGVHVIQRLVAPGVRNLQQEVFLPTYADHIECSASWEMTEEASPEATYLAFPLAVPDARVRVDLGGQAMQPEEDQLPGACRDYFTVQRWVDFSNAEFGVTVACPTTPMVQLGDFTFGRNQSCFTLSRPLLLGWVTNNYWQTNFRAYQPGRVSACYWLLPHQGPFEEAAAHRFGAEAMVPPQLQHLGEPSVETPLLPSGGTLLHLPQEPVLTLGVKPAASGVGTVLHLLNASDAPAPARVASGLLLIRAAQRCDLLGHPLEPVLVTGGSLTLDLPARGLACLHLTVSVGDRGLAGGAE